MIKIPSSKPSPFSFIDIDELREELNFMINDIYSKLDFALSLDGKGVMVGLKYGGLGQDVSGAAAIIGIVGGTVVFVAPLNASGGLTNVTTLNATKDAHGFLPKLSDVVTQFLSGKGTWIEVPAAVLYDANTILKADVDNTPVALTIAEQTIVGRITGGVIAALTVDQVRTLINTGQYYRYAAALADGATVTLPTITANYPAHGFIHCAHASTGVISESAEFEYGSSGAVQIIRGTANIEANGATAGKISLGAAVSANPVVIKNNLGGGVSVNVMITLWYN